MSLSGGLIPLVSSSAKGSGNTARGRVSSSSNFTYGFEESDDNDDDSVMDAQVDEEREMFTRSINRNNAGTKNNSSLLSPSEFDKESDEDWDEGMDDVNEVKEALDDADLTTQYEPAISLQEDSKRRSAANMAALDELFMDDFPSAPKQSIHSQKNASMPLHNASLNQRQTSWREPSSSRDGKASQINISSGQESQTKKGSIKFDSEDDDDDDDDDYNYDNDDDDFTTQYKGHTDQPRAPFMSNLVKDTNTNASHSESGNQPKKHVSFGNLQSNGQNTNNKINKEENPWSVQRGNSRNATDDNNEIGGFNWSDSDEEPETDNEDNLNNKKTLPEPKSVKPSGLFPNEAGTQSTGTWNIEAKQYKSDIIDEVHSPALLPSPQKSRASTSDKLNSSVDEDSWGPDLLDSLMPEGEDQVKSKQETNESSPNEDKPVQQPEQSSGKAIKAATPVVNMKSEEESSSLKKNAENVSDDKPSSYEFSFGRRERRDPVVQAASTTRGSWNNASKNSTSRLQSAKPKKTFTFSDSSDDEDLAILRGPRAVRPWKGLASQKAETSPSENNKSEEGSAAAVDQRESNSRKTIQPSVEPGRESPRRKSVRSVPENKAEENIHDAEKSPHFGVAGRISPHRGEPRSRQVSSPSSGKDCNSPIFQPDRHDSAKRVSSPHMHQIIQAAPPPHVPVIDVSKLVQEVREELTKLHTSMREEQEKLFQGRLASLEAQLKSTSDNFNADRASWREQDAKRNERVLELEASAAEERLSRERAEQALAVARDDHEKSFKLLEDAQNRALEQARGNTETAKTLDKLLSEMGEATTGLTNLEERLAKRHDDSEKLRLAQLECRERLVTDVEINVREQLERSTDEARKLQSLYSTLVETNQLVRRQCEDDRVRLNAEHARLEALQLTLKIEAETIRSDANDARARLREERVRFEAERQAWQTQMHRKETALEAERHSLDIAKRAFESERSVSIREAESALARVREEERLLKESREAQAKARIVLEEQASKLEKEKEALAVESKKQSRDAEELRQKAEETRELLKELRVASQKHRDMEQLDVHVSKSRSEMSREAAQLEQRKQELLEEQFKQRKLRLKVTEERSQVYRRQAEALRETSAARALQRKLTVDAALCGSMSTTEENMGTYSNIFF